MTNKAVLPESFLLPPFFEKGELIAISECMEKELLHEQPMLFDIYEQLNLNPDIKPWEKKFEYIPLLIENWQETEPTITNFFKIRDRKQVMQPMVKVILSLIAFLFWTNGRPVPGLINIRKQIKKLKIKPVNVEERLEFILSAPNQYHSFAQLKTLFSEQTKKYAILKQKEGH